VVTFSRTNEAGVQCYSAVLAPYFHCKQTSASLLSLITQRHGAEQNRRSHDLLSTKTGLNRTGTCSTSYLCPAAIRSSIRATYQLRILVPGAALKVASDLVRHRPHNGLPPEPHARTSAGSSAAHMCSTPGCRLLAVCTCPGRPAQRALHAQHAGSLACVACCPYIPPSRRLPSPQPMRHFHVAGLGAVSSSRPRCRSKRSALRINTWLAGDLHVRHFCGAYTANWTFTCAARAHTPVAGCWWEEPPPCWWGGRGSGGRAWPGGMRMSRGTRPFHSASRPSSRGIFSSASSRPR
jgi:hypothetical protein